MAATATTNRLEGAKPPAGAEKPQSNGGAPATQAAAAAPASGGFKAYLPLIVNLLLMPVLAYALTTYVLVPRLAKQLGAPGAAAEAGSSHATESHGSAGEVSEAKDANGRTKVSVPLSKKTLVNVSGTMGTRYLLAEFILVGVGANFKDNVEKSDAELRDAAASALSAKTIADLEKPGIRNLVRSELITIFNSILGKGAVVEIYLTEFAIQ
jgi:flagellar FliL protein